MRALSKARNIARATVCELRLYPAMLRKRQGKSRVMILPCAPRVEGASLLRAYNIGEYLASQRWSVILCDHSLRRSQRVRIARLARPDVILIQMARHPDNAPQPFAPIPAVFDIDDADFQTESQLPRLLANMEGCRAVIAGSRYIADWCRKHNPDVTVIWTATQVRPGPVRSQRDREKILSWAASEPVGYPREAAFVLDLMTCLKGRRSDLRLRLYGDDGSAEYAALVDRFRDAGIAIETRPTMAYDAFLRSLEDVAVGLNPFINMVGFSAGKSFGKVLAYLDANVPSINTPNVDHPLFFEHGRNGFLADAEVEPWADLAERLIEAPDQRERIAQAARADLVRRLSLQAAGSRVEAVLERAIAASPHSA